MVFSPVDSGLLDHLVLTDTVREAVSVWAAQARQRPNRVPCLLLAGEQGSGRAALARAAVSAAGYALLAAGLDSSNPEEGLRMARRESRWYQAALLLECRPELKRPWSAIWRALAPVKHPLLVSLPPEAAEAAVSAAPFETALITIGEPGLMLRRQLWRQALPPGAKLEPGAVERHFAKNTRNAGKQFLLQPGPCGPGGSTGASGPAPSAAGRTPHDPKNPPSRGANRGQGIHGRSGPKTGLPL